MKEDIKQGYTRVTEVFAPYVNFDMVSSSVLEQASNRGTRVHSYCEMIAQDEYFPDPAAELSGYVDSFRRWFESSVSDVISTERRYYDDGYMVTGAIDLVAVLVGDQEPTIIDYKTSATKSKTWALQTAMYRYLYNAPQPSRRAERRIALQLKRDGGLARVNEYNNYNDFSVYIGLLNAWRFFGKDKQTKQT